jgi:hypothetical protein
MAEQATIRIDAETAQARASVRGLEEGLDDVSVSATQADQAVSGVIDPSDIAAVEAMSSRADELGDELDSTSSSAARARLDLGLLSTSTGAVDTRLIGLLGTLGALNAVLATYVASLGAAGAAGVALSAKFGPTQDRFTQVKAQARGAAQELGKAFAPAARTAANAAEGLFAVLAENAGAIEGFADDLGPLLQSAGGPFGGIIGGFRALAARGRAEDGMGLQARQNRLLRRRNTALDVGDALRAAGAPEPQVLKAQISRLQKARDEFLKYAETLTGEKRDQAEQSLRAITQEIQRLQAESSGLGQTAPAVESAFGVMDASQGQRGTVRVPSAGPRPGLPGSSGGAFDEIVSPALSEFRSFRTASQQGLLSPLQRAQRQAGALRSAMMRLLRQGVSPTSAEFRVLRQRWADASAEANRLQQSTDDTNRALERGIRAATQLGTTLVRAFQRGEVSAQTLLSTVLQLAGSLVSTANPAAGAGLSGFGRIIGAFQHGGRVDTPLQVVGERGPELAALPQGTQVQSTADSRKALGTDLLARKMDALIARVDTLEVRISASETEQSVSTVEAEEERMGAREYSPTS